MADVSLQHVESLLMTPFEQRPSATAALRQQLPFVRHTPLFHEGDAEFFGDVTLVRGHKLHHHLNLILIHQRRNMPAFFKPENAR